MPRKIVFETFGGPEVFKVVEDNLRPLGENEIRVRNKAIGLNFKEVYFRKGTIPVPLPATIGGEAAGIVEEVGNNVSYFKAGDRVAYLANDAYRDVETISEEFVTKIPDSVSFEVAAASLLKGLTAQYMLHQLAYVPQRDEIVLFHAAAGGVGLVFCQWAHYRGVKVIATASSSEKLVRAKENGAWATVNYQTEDWVQRVYELTEGKKVRIVYDSVGKDTWDGSLKSLAPHGLMVSFGASSGTVPEGSVIFQLNAHGGLYLTFPTVKCYASNSTNLREMAGQLFDLIGQGVLKFEINQRYPLAQVAEAHAALEGRKTTGSTILLPE